MVQIAGMAGRHCAKIARQKADVNLGRAEGWRFVSGLEDDTLGHIPDRLLTAVLRISFRPELRTENIRKPHQIAMKRLGRPQQPN